MAAKEDMERAIERYISVCHSTTVMLEGYIIEAMGQSPSEDRPLLVYAAKTGQNGVITAGLSSYLSDNVQDALFFNQDEG